MIGRRGDGRLWLGLAAVLCSSLTVGAAAQMGVAASVAPEQEPQVAAEGAPGGDALPVLHVYTDLLQVPVLVLNHDGEQLKEPAAEDRFFVSLGGGPWYRATHVRQEGDDPISLSILLDVSGWSADAMAKMDEAVAALGMGPLRAQDRVSVYVLDCSLATAEGRMAPDAKALRAAVDELMRSAVERRGGRARGCGREPHHLWDSLMGLTVGLAKQPGRRVILAVTDGEDGGSRHSWQDAMLLAQAWSVTIFGVTYRPPAARVARLRGGDSMDTMGRDPQGPPFPALCELSGGVDRVVAEAKMDVPLGWVAEALRERYIVEFPRPSNGTPGRHELDVRVDGGQDYLIRPAGVTFPGRSQSVLDDPTTIKDDPSLRPTQGQKKSPVPGR